MPDSIVVKYESDLKSLIAELKEYRAQNAAATKQVTDFGNKAKESGDKAAKGIEGINKQAASGSNIFANLGTQIAAAFSVAAVIAFGKATFDSFAKAEVSARKLQAAVGAQGGLTADFNELTGQAEKLQKISIFSDEQIKDAQTMALQFGLSKDAVEDLIPTVIDFASATGQDLQGALSSVLRGIEGQTRGLKVYGIQVSDNQTRAQKFTQILDQLNNKFSDQGRIVGDTASGRLARLANAWDDLKESIGGAIAPLVAGAASLAKSLIGITEVPLSKKLEEERLQLELTTLKLTGLNEGSKERTEIIKTLQSQYPDYLKNIDSEKVSNEDLQKALRRVNDQLILKIALAKGDEEITSANEKVAKALLETSKAEQQQLAAVNAAIKSLSPEEKKRFDALAANLPIQEKANVLLNEFNVGTVTAQANQKSSIKFSVDLQQQLEKATQIRTGADQRLKKVQDELTESQKKRTEEEKRLRGLLNIAEEPAGTGTKTTGLETKTDAEIKAEQDAAQKRLEIRQKNDKEIRDSQNALAKFTFDELSRNIDLEIALEKQAALIRIGNAEDAQGEFLRIEEAGLLKRIQAAKDTLQDIGELEKQLIENRTKQIEVSNKAAANIHPNAEDYKKWLEISEDAHKEDVKKTKEAEEKKRKSIQETFDLAQELTNSLQDLFRAQDEADIQAIQVKRDTQVDAIDEQIKALEEANDRGRLSDRKFETEKKKLLEQRMAAEKQADEEQKKIKRKQAEDDKLLSIFRIGLILAEAIASVNVAKIIAATAELAVVLATPIPSFAKGTKGKKGSGLARVGEEGEEFVFMPHGSQVVPNPQTKKYKEAIDAMIDNRYEDYVYKAMIAPALREATKKMEQNRQKSFAENIANNFMINKSDMNQYRMLDALKMNNKEQAKIIGKEVAKYIDNNSNDRYYH